MASKRTYKQLTKKQTASVKRYTKQGKSQQAIAKLLGVSKQRVSTSQKKVGVGKRVASPFWKDVKTMKNMGYSHKRATLLTKQSPKWGTKRAARAGKKWRTPEERQAEMRRLRREFEGEELSEKMAYEMEDVLYGDTPK